LRRMLLPRTSFAAAAAKATRGLRTASAPLTAPPTEPYVQDCNAGLFVYIPPRDIPGASMLLLRRLTPGAAGGVLLHCHRLDEHLPIADVLEQRILREIKSTGSFSHSSAEVKDWLAQVLPLIGECQRVWVYASYFSYYLLDFSCLLTYLQRTTTWSTHPVDFDSNLILH
jgi:hypothetical protein